MSKPSTRLVIAALAAGIALALPGTSDAAAAKTYPPSHYKPPPVYHPPRHCDWVSVRYRWHGRWHWRRVWRCR